MQRLCSGSGRVLHSLAAAGGRSGGRGLAVVAAAAPPVTNARLKPQPEPAAEAAGPTVVPRAPGVKDGEWAKADARLVELAQKEADKAVEAKSIDKHGVVLLGRTDKELGELTQRYGQPAYRGKQLVEAVLQGARSIEQINTVPLEWRKQLVADGVRTGRSIVHHEASSPDGTRKFLLQLVDGRVVECVGIPVDDEDRSRLTVCVSSQVGCPMRCTFCATGKGGFARNLAPHEILDQVMTVQEEFGKRVSNVVFMGMGEPLLNTPSVVKACELINTQLGISMRNITISTVGVPNAIARLAQRDLRATLAVSIHAPNQELRETIVPSARAYPLHALLTECSTYYRKTGRRVTFEYTLLAGVNDSDAHAAELAQLLIAAGKRRPDSAHDASGGPQLSPRAGPSTSGRGSFGGARGGRGRDREGAPGKEVGEEGGRVPIPEALRGNALVSHVNIIPWNPVDESEFKRPSRNRVYSFKRVLEEAGIPVSIRLTRGLEAAAACGQLRNLHQKEPLAQFAVPA